MHKSPLEVKWIKCNKRAKNLGASYNLVLNLDLIGRRDEKADAER